MNQTNSPHSTKQERRIRASDSRTHAAQCHTHTKSYETARWPTYPNSTPSHLREPPLHLFCVCAALAPCLFNGALREHSRAAISDSSPICRQLFSPSLSLHCVRADVQIRSLVVLGNVYLSESKGMYLSIYIYIRIYIYLSLSQSCLSVSISGFVYLSLSQSLSICLSAYLFI